MRQIYIILCLRNDGEEKIYRQAYTDAGKAYEELNELREQKTLGEGIYYTSEIWLVE